MNIGVFVCHCGSNIEATVDTAAVAAAAREFPGVVFATDTMYTCSEPGQKEIRDDIYEIQIRNPHGLQCGELEISVDGQPIEGNIIPLFGDGQVHSVEVKLQLKQ